MATLAPAYAPRRPTETALYRRRGLLDERPLEERSNEAPDPATIDGCAAIAMYRGTLAMLPASEDEADGSSSDTGNVGAPRSAFAVERLRRLPGGRVAYRVKYVSRGRAEHRVMTSIELLARLSAILPPPRYPLTRYHGVLAPRSAWRREIVPRAPASSAEVTARGSTAEKRRCSPAAGARSQPGAKGTKAGAQTASPGRDVHMSRHRPPTAAAAIAASPTIVPDRGEFPDAVFLTPTTLGIRH